MDQEYTQRLERIEAALDRWLPENIEIDWVEEIFPGLKKKPGPEPLIVLVTPLRDILSRGGKRWRPLLMTLVCESLEGGDAAIPLTPLVELCHNASLIHDDIEDNSNERRGKPSVHKLYGLDTAINSGSFLYFLSLSCIESCAIDNKIFIYKLWAEYMRKLHLGQAMDINWHRNILFVPSIEEYYEMCALKTGCLSRFAVELGAYAAGASEDTARQLGEAAEKLGIGFQILDDVKNLTTGVPGKKRGDDLIEGKKSLPILLYLHKYPEKRKSFFYSVNAARTKGIDASEVEELIRSLEGSGALAEAAKEGQAYITEARNFFNVEKHDGFLMNDKCRALIAGLFDLIS
ncbi:MAG: polyprenyl synthetase family protein [Treponema sp.]|jgi:octaprenyl-diphosphate synthase|nr:polyprenyl synthetase family protein [Treponema sp.]